MSSIDKPFSRADFFPLMPTPLTTCGWRENGQARRPARGFIYSYGAAIAIQWALDAPTSIQSLALLEPPLVASIPSVIGDHAIVVCNAGLGPQSEVGIGKNAAVDQEQRLPGAQYDLSSKTRARLFVS
jgi:pimeloyl-ACP methyl ester carboxylesterase